jgi:uncharacterized iron-regulated membrane protein
MTVPFVKRWLNRPQATWLRKAVFQIHLWAGISLGLYVVIVCASGSAIVFRNDLYDVLEGRKGPAVKMTYRALSWLGDLHGKLLMGADGMTANAIGGALLAGVCLTGMVVWWPGIANWRRAMTIRADVGWKRLMWDLHSAVGFWTFAMLLVWGLTGTYFVFPQPFRATVNYFTPVFPPRVQSQSVQRIPLRSGTTQGSATFTLPRRRRPLTLGGKILRGFSYAHYGNFGGWPVKALWVLLGLAPAVLFGSAMVMWWNRVLRPAARRLRHSQNQQRDAPDPVST